MPTIPLRKAIPAIVHPSAAHRRRDLAFKTTLVGDFAIALRRALLRAGVYLSAYADIRV